MCRSLRRSDASVRRVIKFVTVKCRLAKQRLTIPRLELVSGHMAVNLATNVRQTLEGLPLSTTVHCWLDSSVALHWIGDRGECRQFVANLTRKIQTHPNVLWYHVPSTDNPTYLGSHGGSVIGAKLWWNGPTWLADPSQWPPEIVTEPSPESTAERKVQQELFTVGVEGSNDFDILLERFSLRKAMRIDAWISQFLHNSRHPSKKVQGPLTTPEIAAHELFLVKRAQQQDQEQLNLQPNVDGVLECRGRIQGEYPIYLPDSVLLAAKVVQLAHVTTLHGGVGLTMANEREKYWIPRIQKLNKRVVRNCSSCKHFQSVAFTNPPPAPLPRERAEGNALQCDWCGFHWTCEVP